MSRFDLYANPDEETLKLAPFLLDIQSTYVEVLPTRIVIPLRPVEHLSFLGSTTDLLPIFDMDGRIYFLDTPSMGAIPVKALGRRIGSLAGRQDAILAALDRIFGAY